MNHVLITGANRGIGLALTRRLLEEGVTVYAACRKPDQAKLLSQLMAKHAGRLHLIQLEITDQESITAAAKTVKALTKNLDALINNAGILHRGESPESLDPNNLRESFDVNAIGPLMVTSAFLPLLKKGERPVILNLSSQLGSLQRKKSGGLYSYGASKAALNMLSKALAYDLQKEGIIVVVVHPGWVQTDMGGSGAAITADASAEGLIKLLNGFDLSDSGSFLTWEGEQHPW